MNKLWHEAFAEGITILSIIERNGHEAYFVGGCVRDLLLQQSIKDIDIASSALPEEIMEMFEHVIPVGLEHGTVIVRYANQSYEVTTFRHEKMYSDRRHPDEVTFIRRVEEDLKRRDFTMNALAMNSSGIIIDPFNGQDDLHAQLIRSVGEARDRFLEDPLRIMRGIRFVSQLGFQLDADTYQEMIHLRAEIETIAIERITEEITKLFQGNFVDKGIKCIINTKVFRHIPIWKDHPQILKRLPTNITAFHSLAEVLALFHYLDETIPIAFWTRSWKCSKKTKRISLNLFQSLKMYKKNGLTKWLVYHIPPENHLSFIHLINVLYNHSIEEDFTVEYNSLTIFDRSQLNIDGHELQQVFSHLYPGKWIEESLKRIEFEVAMNYLPNTKKDIKEWILCHPPEIS